MEIRLATPDDIEDIRALMRKYHINSILDEDKPDGFVTTNMSALQMESLISRERGITIAGENGSLAAFAMAGSWGFWSEWPLFEHMIGILPEYSFDGQALTTENTYQYGPICVDKSWRGKGVFESVFAYSLRSMRERYPIMLTFINQINGRSYAAHTRKARMSTIGAFAFNQNNYYLLACLTDNERERATKGTAL